MSNTPIALALYGCGGISAAHVKGYADLWARGCREFTVTACCDINPAAAETRADEIAAYQGSRPAVLTSAADLVAAEVAQAADICLPHCFHHVAAIELLQGGLHVAVEKPLGLTIRASKAIMAAAEEADRIVSTSEDIRRFPTARAGAWALNQRKLIGEPLFVEVQGIKHGPFDFSRPASAWRGLKALTGGGMIMDSGAHFADMVQVLLGEPDTCWCHMQSNDTSMISNAPVVGDAPADVEDAWHAVITFKSGVRVAWTYSRAYYGPETRQARYYGTEGTLVDHSFPFHPFQVGGDAHLADGTVVTSDEIVAMYRESLSEEQEAALFPYGCEDGFGIEMWDFVNAIATGRAPEMDGMAGLRAKTLCEALYESATAGVEVRYDDVLAGEIDAYQRPIDEVWDLV